MKKLTLFLALLLCASFLLTACNGDNTPDTTPAVTEAPTEPLTPEQQLAADRDRKSVV